MLADPPAKGLPAAIAMYAPSRDHESPATPFPVPLVANVSGVPLGVGVLTGLDQNWSLPVSSPTASSVPVGAKAAASTLTVVLLSTVNADTGAIVDPVFWNVPARPVSKPTAATICVALEPACSDKLSG